MPFLKPIHKFTFITFMLFVGVLFLAFLPISSFLFFIKNDAFTNYFPPKFFMSESIHAGYLPLWNPYINFGIPQYGDMNAGYWSPVTWFIASTVGYNAYTLTLETMLYILTGGMGMYKLMSTWIENKNIRIIAGLAFMCCGFNVAHLQHFNWLSGAAFLPWCFWSYLIFLKNRTLPHTLTTVLLFYLFIASAHPGLIIGSFYFFIAIAFFIFKKNEEQLPFKTWFIHFSKAHGMFFIALIVLATGIIAGYTDIIPHFVRGDKINLENSLPHSSNIKTWISLLFPFSTVKNEAFFNTELTLRNSYFSLVLLVFILMAILGKKNSWQKFLLLVGLSFALVAAGGWAKTFAHHYIPFIGYVRLNGEFRIFAILSFIIVASIELEKFILNQQPGNADKLKRLCSSIMILLLCSVGWALYNAISSQTGMLYNRGNFISISGFSEKAKYVIDHISFYEAVFIQGFAQIILLVLIYKSLKIKNTRLLQWWIIADLILSTLLNVPFTGAGKTSVAHLQSVINLSPKGIPIPALHPIGDNDTLNKADNALLGNWSMYNKQPGTITEMPYPIQLKNMRSYFDSLQHNTGISYAEKPFLFIKEGNAGISILHFSPNKIIVRVNADTASKLIIQQNEYPYWYYKTNAEFKKVLPEGISFMAVPVNKGMNEIILHFRPAFIKTGLLLSGLFFMGYLFVIVFYKTKRL
jgi:hypothetical protein